MTGEVWASQVHTQSVTRKQRTPGHNHIRDWIRFMGPMGTLNGWLNITCHVNIKKLWHVWCHFLFFLQFKVNCWSWSIKWLRLENNIGPVKNVNKYGVKPGVEEDQYHVEAGGQGDSQQLPGLRGPRTMVRTQCSGQEISFHIPGKCHVRASHETRKKKFIKKCP